MPLRDISQSGCEERCRGNPLCMAFVFNKRFNVCFLKGNATLLFADDMAFAGYRIDRNVTPKMTRLKARGRRIYQGEQLRQFDELPLANKVCFYTDSSLHLKCGTYLPGYELDRRVPDGWQLFSICQGRFDAMRWFSGGRGKRTYTERVLRKLLRVGGLADA
jgi:hypothetical protein